MQDLTFAAGGSVSVTHIELIHDSSPSLTVPPGGRGQSMYRWNEEPDTVKDHPCARLCPLCKWDKHGREEVLPGVVLNVVVVLGSVLPLSLVGAAKGI